MLQAGAVRVNAIEVGLAGTFGSENDPLSVGRQRRRVLRLAMRQGNFLPSLSATKRATSGTRKRLKRTRCFEAGCGLARNAHVKS